MPIPGGELRIAEHVIDIDIDIDIDYSIYIYVMCIYIYKYIYIKTGKDMMFPHLNFQIQIHTIDDLLMSLVILDCDIALCVCQTVMHIYMCIYKLRIFSRNDGI